MISDVGSRAELARLLVQHRPGLYGYILACARDHEDATQIWQKVTAAVTEGNGAPPSEPGFLSWAREIARKQVLSHVPLQPHKRPVDPVLAQRLAEAAVRVEAMRPASQYREALLSCLENLPARSRLLLAMRHDNSVAGIGDLAARLGRTVPAALAMIKQVKQLLRECVERRSVAKFNYGITRSE
jgi:DNA-directed RNA polymerase specialized sigma24 family protein